MTTERGYDWRHGWVPLTMRAALQKTRGNREEARRLLDEARAERRRRRAARGPVEFRPPSPRHQAAAAERARWAGRDDEDLADELGRPDVDDATVERVLAELDRRDRAAKKATAERERRAAARRRRNAAAEARFDELLAAGEDPQRAYADAYGIDEERVRKAEAIESLRSSGYRGKGFDELVRHAFRDHVEQTYFDAEDECRGSLTNKAGEALAAKGRLHPRDLFTGPEARARKYASDELLNYWQQNGRLTVDDFKASLMGGAMRSTSTAAWA